MACIAVGNNKGNIGKAHWPFNSVPFWSSIMDLTIGLFNHTQQRAEVIDINVSDVQEWIDNMQAEYTIECCELEGDSISIKNFGELCTLTQWLEANPHENAEAIADFIGCFSVQDLDGYHDAFTGCTDFSEYAAEYADDCILCDLPKNHPARSYFDYDTFERDFKHDFTVGVFVWRNI